ncbi:DNA topoisomerase [Duganella sp. LjRoot269]|uniref:DNA topoisomerase n=1 Tax=Duganella sp. LjRoot269 TaxID=3342305 RepID=UPI003ECF8E2B
MTKTLIIAEKPSVAEDIAKSLGGFTKTRDGFEREDTIVSAAAGHLAAVSAPGADKTGKSLETLPIVPARFDVAVINDERAKARFALLQRLMARPDVSTVVNACDAGREGELIFRLIYEAAGCRKPSKRMWLQSMTPDAIREGWKGMRAATEYDRLADAARCRTESDWLIGINGSRGVTYLQEALSGMYQMSSLGRVQTPTLAIVVDLEDKIRNFKPQDYYEIHGTFAGAGGSYEGRWYNQTSREDAEGKNTEGPYRILDKAQAESILAKCRGVAPSSVRDLTQPTQEQPPKLFDLTTLQREVNKRYKLSAAETLKIAQSLYERHKVTTYPRTDASALPEDYVEPAREVMKAFSGTPYDQHARTALEAGWIRSTKRIFDNSKISDHFAIIPTGVVPQGLSEAEQCVYDMIARRFIAAFYPAAEYMQTTRETIVSGEMFRSTGRVMKVEGWRAVYGTKVDEREKKSMMAPVQPGERVNPVKMEMKAKKTKEPERLTEGRLLTAMETAGKTLDDDALSEAMGEKGLGTPATRAAIIENLLNAGTKEKPKVPYLERVKDILVPTEKGMNIIHFLRANGIGALTSPAMTGEWEYKLQLMSEGKYTRDAFMAEIGVATHDMLDAIRSKAPVVERMTLSSPCPRCGGAIHGGLGVYACARECGFSIKRMLLSRPISPAEAEAILRDRITGVLEGFVSPKTGKPFNAKLKLNAEFKLDFEFPDRAVVDPATLAAAPALTQKCPKCKGTMRALPERFVCETNDFSFARTISGRTMSEVEADYLLAKRTTPKAGGFLSVKKNKYFEAAYKLTKDFKVELVFD